MWIQCRCGHQIKDTTDGISYKARYISDQDWFGVLDTIDRNIQSLEKNREKLCWDNHNYVSSKTKCIYQCTECERLYVENQNGEFREFLPIGNECNNILHG